MNKTRTNKDFLNLFFVVFGLLTPALVMLELNIGFLVKNLYILPVEHV